MDFIVRKNGKNVFKASAEYSPRPQAGEWVFIQEDDGTTIEGVVKNVFHSFEDGQWALIVEV